MIDTTLGAYTRHEAPDYADGGVTAALIEKEVEQPDAEVQELRSALAREVARGNALQDALDATSSPRPLTPDAITDEMVERVWQVWCELPPRDMHSLRIALTAALTEPPARPEGAADVAVRLFQAGTAVGVHMTAEQRDELADHLAAMHVRVVTENEDPR